VGHFAIGEIPYSKMLAYHKNRLGAGRNRRIPCKRRDDGSKKTLVFYPTPKNAPYYEYSTTFSPKTKP